MNNPRSELLSRRPRTGFPVKDEALFLTHLPVIDAAIKTVCRRNHLSPSDADDFASDVRLRLLERGGEPLAKFEGRSSLQTFLVVVVTRLFLDYRNHQWGKWRPSAEARRQGPIAILVERLLVREGRTFDQVVETLRTNHGVEMTPEIETICVRVAARLPARQFVSDVEAIAVQSAAPPPDANVVRAEQDFLAKRVKTALDKVRQTLPAEERLILRMQFQDAMSVADIARALHLDQKRLYRTVERVLATVRDGLLAEGIDGGEVRELLASGALGDVDADEPQGCRGSAAAAYTERARSPWRS